VKKVLFFLGILFVIACSKTAEISSANIQSNPIVNQPVSAPKYILNNFTITNFSIPNITEAQIQKGVNGSISGTILYSKDNVLNLVIPATLFFNAPLIPALHLIKSNNSWQFENSYDDGAMGCARNYECIDSLNQSWVYADHGFELSSGIWPFGNMVLMKTTGKKLSFSNISSKRSFYHSISTGDLNNDGLNDVVGLHMGTKGDWGDNLHTYLQNKDGTFTENRTILVSNLLGGRGAGALLIKDLFGDSRPEVIKADYGFNSTYQKQSDRYSFMIFSYNIATNKYELSKDPGPLGVYATNDRGTTSIKAADFNKDGALDLAIATEGTKFNGIEIWINDGKGNFTPSNQKLEYTFEQLQFREFEVFDYDKDGYPDIFLNPWSGKFFKDGSDVFMDNLIWKNTAGIFGSITKGITIPNINPTFMKAFFINNQITYMGIKGNIDGSITLNEINPNY
jgi:hypothetical protein